MQAIGGRRMRNKILPAALAGGLVGGAIDIAYAMTWWNVAAGVPPGRIFQSIAAGWVGGKAAREGGVETMLLGAVSHFGIAIVMALVYCAASLFLPVLRQRPVVMGLLYGIGLWLAMNYMVVPLSAAGGGEPQLDWWTITGIVVHAAGVGLPIALSARWIMGKS